MTAIEKLASILKQPLHPAELARELAELSDIHKTEARELQTLRDDYSELKTAYSELNSNLSALRDSTQGAFNTLAERLVAFEHTLDVQGAAVVALTKWSDSINARNESDDAIADAVLKGFGGQPADRPDEPSQFTGQPDPAPEDPNVPTGSAASGVTAPPPADETETPPPPAAEPAPPAAETEADEPAEGAAPTFVVPGPAETAPPAEETEAAPAPAESA